MSCDFGLRSLLWGAGGFLHLEVMANQFKIHLEESVTEPETKWRGRCTKACVTVGSTERLN
jgi:hypothetical protein